MAPLYQLREVLKVFFRKGEIFFFRHRRAVLIEQCAKSKCFFAYLYGEYFQEIKDKEKFYPDDRKIKSFTKVLNNGLGNE